MTAWTLVSGDFVTTGGMDRANFALASYLARAGHRVELVAHRIAPALATQPAVTFRPVPKPLASYFLGRWPLNWAGQRFGLSRRTTGGRVVVNGGNCRVADVNWVHYVHAAYRPERAVSGWRACKTRIERTLDLRDERRALRVARVVVCNSSRTRRDVIRHLSVPPERAVTVYYGCDPAVCRPVDSAERTDLRSKIGWPQDRPIVMFVGALGDRRKGFDSLFAAWQQLCKLADWDALLVVVGSGAELPQWERRVSESGLNERVRFLGFRSDVPDLLRVADALVSPTRYEAYGLGVHEALCCGLPAFVSASAGVAERYPAELAELLLPNPDDAADIASRLRRWRDSHSEYRWRVRSLSDRLREYTWDDMARSFLAAVGEA